MPPLSWHPAERQMNSGFRKGTGSGSQHGCMFSPGSTP
jgi:hypothetical protein